MAIKGMNTLIKLYKRRIDVLRREMVALEEEREQVVNAAETLRQEYARELALSSTDPHVGRFFAAYSEQAKKRQERLAQEIVTLTEAIEAKAALIREEFSEQKKFEIARDNAKKRADMAASNALQQRFDEIALQQHMRQDQENHS